jgi:RES domain
MAKLPQPPGVEALQAHPPALIALPASLALARIYFTEGIAAASWRRFRTFGPLGSRFDHHLPDANGLPQEQERAILYCAVHVDTCLAECFQLNRQIDRVLNSPWLAIFRLVRDVHLLDLTGPFTTRMGASTALNSGSRKRARGWSRDLYLAYPQAEGILYPSSMNGHAPAVALYERAQSAVPQAPLFNRALSDDTLLDVLKHSAATLGYGVT